MDTFIKFNLFSFQIDFIFNTIHDFSSIAVLMDGSLVAFSKGFLFIFYWVWPLIQQKKLYQNSIDMVVTHMTLTRSAQYYKAI